MHTYESDYTLWAKDQAIAIADRRFDDLDIENIAEEMRDLGNSQYKELRSSLYIIILHLLKWQAQPYDRSSSWIGSINDKRVAIESVLEDSPSLRNRIEEAILKMYPKAVKGAASETGMKEGDFPKECPFSFDAIMSLPVAKDGIR